MNLPAEVQTAFDQNNAEQMRGSVAGAQSEMQQAADDRDQQHQEAVDQAHAENERLVEQADQDQQDRVQSARRDIQQERDNTVAKQQEEVDRANAESDQRREQDRSRIDTRVEDDRQQIDQHYQQADADAQREVQNGERQAEDRRRQAERDAENQSWWDRAVNFVRDAFNALVSAIGTIFDAVRRAVNAILDAVRDFAVGLINAIATFIKEAIAAFGEFLKFLVENLIGAIFPQLAAALTQFIDRAVTAAQSAIDAVAEGLRSAVNALVEGLRRGINAIIDVYQAAVNLAVGVLQAALTGDWGALARQVLEAVLKALGIDPAAVYEFIGKAQDTIQLIIDNPGAFLGHVIDAFTGGIRRFADNFLTHLQAGIIGWLTGAIGGAGITLPQRFDLMGVLSLIQQILGLTWANLRIRIVRLVGERAVQALEFVASYVQTLVEGGWSALWERIQNDLATLRDMVLEQIKSFLVERIIMAAITRLATMFNPIGALLNLVLMLYNFYTFLRDQLQRIFAVAQSIINALSDIARGVIQPAIERVEGVLASLLPLVIDLLARLIGLGNIGERVRSIMQSVQNAIWGAIDRLIERVLASFRGGGAPAGGAAPGTQPGTPAGAAGEAITVGNDLTITGPGATHHLLFHIQGRNATLMVQSETQPLADLLGNWEAGINFVEQQRQDRARDLIRQIRSLLQEGDREADIITVARWQAREQTPQARERAREVGDVERSLAAHQQRIVPLLSELFGMFTEDTRVAARRFEEAQSIDVFQGPFTTEQWVTQFRIGERAAQFHLQWGRENNRAIRDRDGRHRLKLDDQDLVTLAARIISGRGRLSVVLGQSRPFFMAADVRAFCLAEDRLPSDPARYNDEVVGRIVRLLEQRQAIRQDQQTPTQFIFSEIPDKRGVPSNFDTDRYRNHFYINRSNFRTVGPALVDTEFERVKEAVPDLLSSDPTAQARGNRVWSAYRRAESVYDQDFSTYSTSDHAAFLVKKNWAADHKNPLARHWGQGDPPGNNTTEPVRHEIAAGDNLKFIWGPKNREEQARGGSFAKFNYVGPEFKSFFTESIGPQYVAPNEKWIEYVPGGGR
jgi:hypothetical protein